MLGLKFLYDKINYLQLDNVAFLQSHLSLFEFHAFSLSSLVYLVFVFLFEFELVVQSDKIIEMLTAKYPFNDIEKESSIKRATEELYGNGKKRSNTPTLIALGGQPGSGKSSLTIYSENKFFQNGEDVCKVEADFCREYFKHSIEIQQKYAHYYTEYTKSIAEIIMENLLEKLYNDRMNVIIETPLTRQYFK